MSEIEVAAYGASHAFQRWIMGCTRAAGEERLAIVDVLVLHHIAHRHGGDRLGELCFVLNIEETHVVAYSVRKLAACGLIAAARHGKDKTYALTSHGHAHVQRYEEIRAQHLLAQLQGTEPDRLLLRELARYLRTMSGHYDQAARAASSL